MHTGGNLRDGVFREDGCIVLLVVCFVRQDDSKGISMVMGIVPGTPGGMEAAFPGTVATAHPHTIASFVKQQLLKVTRLNTLLSGIVVLQRNTKSKEEKHGRGVSRW